jgi:diaminohydroxyphosphoribosylaminopyrimidine deaminase/5-amino-6-(5-phosphoribosylamino)uracil reductase
MNVRFFTFHQKKRPYIILKWAQSMDGNIASAGKKHIAISGETTNRLIHRWRTEEASILVGTETALIDDPQLTARMWEGKNPVRLVTDAGLRLPPHLKLFDQNNSTIVFNTIKDEEVENTRYYKLKTMQVNDIINACYILDLQSVIIEGGAALLQSFIEADLYDEVRVITNTAITIPGGFSAPKLKKADLKKQEWLATDLIHYYS